MLQTDVFDANIAKYEAWFDKYPHVFESEVLAIRRQLESLPGNIHGIEIGLGTGRYAVPLGIKEGVEPAGNMRAIALKRGIEAMDAVAEHLPYKDLHFDFVLFVTICHLNNIHEALKEAHRVLKNKGSIIIGFIDKNSPLGKKYEAKRTRSIFYKHARFYSTQEVAGLLKETGFRNPVFSQTLFGDIDNINELEAPREGHGEGAFVVVRADK